MKIAVLLPNWVGDVAMATPALRSLRSQHPDAEIIGVLRPYLNGLLTKSNGINEFLFCEHRKWSGENGLLATVAELRRRKLDLVVNLRGAFRSAIMSVASAAKHRLGVASNWFWPFYNNRPRKQKERTLISAVDRYLSTVVDCESSAPDRQLTLSANSGDEALADSFWRANALPGRDLVTMINGGAAQGNAKRWPMEKFAELTRRLVDQWGQTVIVNCGPAERQIARTIQQQAGRSRVITLADEPNLSFGFLKALVRRVGLLVSTDSGPRHIAAAVGTPVVAIFGSIDPRLSFNYHPHETMVRLELPCSPCNSHRCPLGHQQCTRDLTVDRVLEAVAFRLKKSAVAA